MKTDTEEACDNNSTVANQSGDADFMVDAMLYGDLDMDVALSEAIPGLKDKVNAAKMTLSAEADG